MHTVLKSDSVILMIPVLAVRAMADHDYPSRSMIMESIATSAQAEAKRLGIEPPDGSLGQPSLVEDLLRVGPCP